jgi:uncharacterized protein (DUF2252 family)
MDIKEATAPAAPRYEKAEMPTDNAERVVTGARDRSPSLGDRMIAMPLMRKAVFIRELLPQDLKPEIEHSSQDAATGIAEFLAYVVGRAHARQLNASERAGWLAELRTRSGTLEASSWLWSSVVDLAAAHEAAYLRHCRRYDTITD